LAHCGHEHVPGVFSSSRQNPTRKEINYQKKNENRTNQILDYEIEMDWESLRRSWFWLPRPIRDSAVGFGTSASAIAITFPAETLVRQFHVTDRAKHNTRTLVKEMSKRGARGFYQGLGPALITQPVFWAVYAPTYGALKRFSGHDSFVWNMGQSYAASCFAAAVSNPLWVLRQRMQTEIVKGKRNTYPSLIRELGRENGARTFFRGLNVTMVKNVQMMALMPLFEKWKDQAQSGEGWGGMIKTFGLNTTVVVAISAASAKIVSSTAVYPLDVLRTNMRFVEGKTVTVRNVAKDVLLKRSGGALNLFRGLGWYWVSASSMFGLMQAFKAWIEPYVEEHS